MFSEGELGGKLGGGICWEARLEVFRGDTARGRGDGGTELRSGAMAEGIECS
jgi:hypothetical protein